MSDGIAKEGPMNRRMFLIGTGAGVLAAPPVGGADGRPALLYRAADVELIAGWVPGRDPGKAFDETFPDATWLTDAADVVAYTDVAGVDWPKGLRPVPYDFVQARLEGIRRGGKHSPGVVVTGSVPA